MSAARFVSAVSAWSVSFAPDGSRLAYVSDRNGLPQLFVANADGSNETLVASGSEHVQAAHWSNDGRFIALLTAPGGSPRTDVWVVRPDGSDLRRLSGSPAGASYLGPWSHEGSTLAVSRTTSPTAGVAELIDVETGSARAIARGGSPLVLDLDRGLTTALVRRGPRGARSLWLIDLRREREAEIRWDADFGFGDVGRLSDDGKIAYVRSNAGRDRFALFAIDLEDGAPVRTRLLAERAEAELEDLVWPVNGNLAALVWNRWGRSECELLDLAAGSFRELLLPEPVAHGGTFSADGRRLAFSLEGPTHPRAVHVLDLEQMSWQRVTTQPSGFTKPTTTPLLERFRAADGLELSGWLYKPAVNIGKPAAVLHFHGGPEAQERPTFNPLFQALSAHGITVFAPNVRGSAGFGRAFENADNRELRFGAIADVRTCAEHLFEQGLATPETLACAGRSYGGYLTLAALVFHPDLFAAGVDICGMSDFSTFYRDTEPWIATMAYPKYGHPERDRELLHELSPLPRFDALRAPLLIVHGENDSNVPLGEAHQAWQAARARGVPSELMLFPGEGHELARRENRERFVNETVAWLEEQLLGLTRGKLLSPTDPAPFRVQEGEASSQFFLTCDHAGRTLPRALGNLGLSQVDLERHIAWDIGAEGLAFRLAERLRAFLIVQTYSRLVIDCNRHIGVPSSIALTSESTDIPGNVGLSAAEAEMRANEIFRPYHARITSELERRRQLGTETLYIAVHSFTPRFLEVDRRCHVGVLYGKDTRYASHVLARLRQQDRYVVGDNEPYFVTELSDYGVIEHAEHRGLPYVELEVRQDLLLDEAGQSEWADLLAEALAGAAKDLLEGR